MNVKQLLMMMVAAGVALAPAADAAPKKRKSGKKTGKVSAKVTPGTHAKDHGPSAPEHHEAEYKRFFEALEKQRLENSYDTCPALTIALLATGDEFCVESWMQRAADEGNAVAIYFMASKNLFHIPQSKYQAPEIKASVALLKKAVDMKYTPAMVDYSAFQRQGIGVFKNREAADRTLMDACRSGSFETRFSWLLQTGRLETFADMQRAEVKSEIARGNHHILYYMSSKAPDTQTSISLLSQAARQGNNRAMFELSVRLSATDAKASYQFLRLAVQYHNPDAMHQMALLLMNPPEAVSKEIKLKKNEASAITFLKVAAMLGDPASRARLSHYYYHGTHGLPKDLQKAYRHVAIASVVRPDLALSAAQGFMLMAGIGVEKNAARGIPMLQFSLERKYVYARALLAYAYYRGYGVEMNGKETVKMLETMALLNNFPMAFVYLALVYDEGGAGIEKDPKKVEYYMKHAELSLPGLARQVFEDHKKNFGGWHLAPLGFDER